MDIPGTINEILSAKGAAAKRRIHDFSPQISNRVLCGWTAIKDLLSRNRTGFDRLPGASLRFRVHGRPDIESFLHVGRRCSEDIVQALRKNGREINSFGTILDFGCGCGRTLMWLIKQSPASRLFGTDIDREAIGWCTRNLSFGGFDVNGPQPPLRYESALFDLVYAVSVFTHLDESEQAQWLGEFVRIVKPGGWVLLTLHGPSCVPVLPPDYKAQFERRGFVFFRPDDCRGIFPTRYQAAYHAEQYVRGTFSQFFKIRDYIPRGLNDHQDVVVLQKDEV